MNKKADSTRKGSHKHPSKKPVSNRGEYKVLGFVLLATLISYLPVFKNGFVNWDESIYIRDNLLIRTFDLKSIFSTYQIGNYHPLTMLVYTIEYLFFGLNEWGYHTVNLVIHLLNVILVYRLITMLTGKLEIAIIASLLFGIHPLHVESVAWAAELKDLLYTFFFLLSCIYYLNYAREGNKKQLFYSVVLFLCSLLSKGMAVSLPIVLLLIDYFTGRKLTMRSISDKLPYFALALVFGFVAIAAQRESGATDIIAFPFFERIVFACYGIVMYLFKLLMPVNLSAFYPYPVKPGNDIPALYYLSLPAVTGIIAAVFYSMKKTKTVFFGFGFFIATVFLVLQLFPVGSAVLADRYSYVPSIGIFYLAAEGCFFLWNRFRNSNGKKQAVAAVLTIFILFYSATTFSRTKVWNNPESLWTSVIDMYPEVPMAYSNRGLHLANENKFEAALSDMNKAAELAPDFSKIFLNRALVLMYLNRYADALKDYNKTIELDPEYAEAYNNRGLLYKDERKFSEALNDYNKAIELDPELFSAYNNRGFIFLYSSKPNEALADFNKAIELNPDYSEAYANRGMLNVQINKPAEALDDFNTAIELQPNNALAYYDRGVLFLNQKKYEDALTDFNMAKTLDPGYSDAYLNSGAVLVNLNRLDEALEDLNKAIALDPNFADAFYNRGMLYNRLKKFPEAISDFSRSIEMNPQFYSAYYQRAIAEYYLGRKEEACGDALQASKFGVPNAKEMFDKFCK